MSSNGAFKLVGRRGSNSKAWDPCKVYASARIGDEINIGNFSEIGDGVEIGDRTRIGAFAFIPEGVKIGKDVFIGPRVTFTNDKHPPSGKANWGKTVIEDEARIGAAVTILPGVRIGSRALIGSGAVVTRDVPPGETWVGVPAKKIVHQIDEGFLPKEAQDV